MNKRSSGVLLHPTSLFNSFPIGDLGPAAHAFVDFLSESGQGWWQMLPIGPAGGGDSPYQSISAFAGNPLLLSPDWLVEQGFLDCREIESSVPGSEGKVDFAQAQRLKLGWFQKAFEQFERRGQAAQRAELDAFASAEAYWLGDYSLFLALQAREGTPDWCKWASELRTRNPDALQRAQIELAGEIRYHQFVQWQFSRQWKELREACRALNIRLIGDIPLFVSRESADVWAHPEIFKLNPDGTMPVVAGVPPDYFSPTGQVWGVPVYRWEVLQTQNYRWWIERLRTAFGRFDLNRLDHFIGFVRTFEVPGCDRTAERGQYLPGGGEAFFEAVRKAFGSLPFIAEDLGILTPEVVALRDQFQLPGSRVLQFEYESSLDPHADPLKPHLPNSVVYTGTHDNDTTAGWYAKLSLPNREALRKRLGVEDSGAVWAIIGDVLASPANLSMVPAQDLLGLGTEARMNIPGTPEGNWGWRLANGALTSELAQRLQNLTIQHGRLLKS
jgi:4-alpha-glucanotransferase